MTVVNIAGMHRSGTSMITRLLNLCGVYLGDQSNLLPPDPDNTEGYWEHRQFVLLNDELLSELGGGWDYPPNVDEGWETSPELSHFRSRASELVQNFSAHRQWGWKDPRNSLTYPFWKQLLPSMKVVICLRNPQEVVDSLIKRNYFSPTLAFNLWLEYNKRIMSYIEPENRIITHYDSYFQDPYSELSRILKFLDMNVSEKQLIASIQAVSIPLRHNQSTLLDLMSKAPSNVMDLYQKMCAQSGPVLQLSSEVNTELQTSLDKNLQGDDGAKKIIRLLSLELLRKKQFIIEKEQSVQGLLAQVAQKEQAVEMLSMQVAEKEQSVQALLAQVAQKEQATQTLSTQVAEKEQAAQALSAQVAEKEQAVQGLSAQMIENEQTAQAKIVEKEQTIDTLIAQKKQTIDTLIAQLAEKGQTIDTLATQLAEKKQAVQVLTTHEQELAEIKNSKTWKIAFLLRQIRALLAPPNSRRARVLHRSINAISALFNKIKRNQKLKEDSALISRSDLFNQAWYLTNNPDVAQAKVDPLLHYLRHGALEGRDPGPNFSSAWYLETYEDVKKARGNPLVHYLKYGREEGRHPNLETLIRSSGLFDDAWYLANNPDVAEAKVDPLFHYLHNGAFEGRDPGPNFSSAWYLETYEDVKKAGINPLVHYLKYCREIAAYSTIADSTGTKYVPITEENVDPETAEVKLIAFYLPQFHPIPENDEWWGKGFTEWTNVSKSVPNFRGHYQPHLPGELGFYDLRIPELQKRQIELARKYGLYGFCFYYYWFNGRRLLERPLNQVLENPDLDFPFCVCWANENWTRRWDGAENEILIGQTHSEDEYLAFIQDIIPILKDSRYIRVDGKPLLAIYRINLLPNPEKAAEIWRSECRKMGIEDIYLAAIQSFGITDPRPFGFDAAIEFPPHNLWQGEINKAMLQITNPSFSGRILDYRVAARSMICKRVPDYTLFKTIMPSWDNTARKQNDGHVFINSTPDVYKEWLVNVTKYTKRNIAENKQFVFVNAWNEWGEGTHLEPDRLYGYAYLQATAEAIAPKKKLSVHRSDSNWSILFISHDAIMGGAQTVLLNTISWLKAHTTLSIKILCLEGGEWLHRFKELADTVVLYELQQKGSKKTEEDLVNALVEFCDGKPDLIYGNTVAAGRVYSWLSKVGAPILTHFHELEMSIKHYGGGWMTDIIENSSHFIACSGAVRDNLISNHNVAAEKITVSYASVSSDRLDHSLGIKEKDQEKQRLGLTQNKYLIFGCGLGMPFRKGADLFIELGRILHREGRDDFHLYWIGSFEEYASHKDYGNWSDHLTRLTQSDLAPYITFLGRKENPKEYLRLGDVFVLPSREDPFPLVALEAADCGLPIICFENAGGMPEFVSNDAGYVVPYLDMETMASKLIFLMENNDLRKQQGTRAREKFLNNFTVERAIPNILSTCRKVANKKPAVSVIVPNYNHAKYLPMRLDSIVNQTYQDFELILLDDASTDESLKIMNQYAGIGDTCIIQNEQNSGSPFRQWLKGISLAKANIWWIAESDDVCEPNLLQSLLPAFQDNDVKIAYANSSIIDEDGVVVGDYINTEYLASLSTTKWSDNYTISATQEINEGLGIKNTILNISAVLIRSFEIPANISEPLENMRIAGDWFFIVNAIKGGKVYYASEKLNQHRRHSESIIGKTLSNKRIADFFKEFYIVQQAILTNYNLSNGFQEKWEQYLRHQWHDFCPDKPFSELEQYYPFNRMKERITKNPNFAQTTEGSD